MKQLRRLGASARPMVLAALAVASASAFADAGNASGNNGAMTFANVNVVSAAIPAATAPTAGSAGMRAQKDKDTGELRAPTAAEVAELDARAKSAPAPQINVRAAATGGLVAKLDDSFLSYEVAHKDASGKLVKQCVTGESAADHAMHNPVTEESHNDR